MIVSEKKIPKALVSQKQKELNSEISKAVSEIWDLIINWQKSGRSDSNQYIYRAINKFNKRTFPYLNRKFKKIFDNYSPEAKKGGIYIRNFYGINISDLLHSNLVPCSKNISTNGNYAYYKYKFCDDTLFYIVFYVSALILANKEYIVPAQYYAACFMSFIEFIDLKDMKWEYAKNYMEKFFYSHDVENFMEIIESFRDEKIKSDSIRTNKKKGQEHKSKIQVPVAEIQQLIESGLTQSEIKKNLAFKYSCSEKTIQRKMKELGLTRNYQRIS